MKLIKTFINYCNKRNRLVLHNNNKYCGEISYVNKKNVTIITNLYVDPAYRNNGYATKLLKEAEKSAVSDHILKQSLHCKLIDRNFKLCAWDPIDKPHLVSFYNKNGYKIDATETTKYYDDGDQIFELIKMSKEIVIDPLAEN